MAQQLRLRRQRSPEVIEVAFHSRRVLAASFMPALAGGGLFVPTAHPYRLGDEVCLVASLFDTCRIPVMGRVAWVTPPMSVSHRVAGIGVRFVPDENAARLTREILNFMPEEGRAPAHSHTF